MIKFILWLSAALHFFGAIWAAASVTVDYSNQVAMMFIALALFVGAIVDAFIACAIRPATEVRYVKTHYAYDHHQNKAFH